MSSKLYVRSFQLIVGIILLTFVAGCNALSPEFTYQGKLTDENGVPLNGSYDITYKLYKAATGGTAIYTETETVNVTDGLFESVIGSTSNLGSLTPEDLTEKLYIELTIDDGTTQETLTPRQQLYGAPYAFTLMPGTIISGEFDTNVIGASSLESVVTIQNMYDGTPSNPALPALRVIGENGIELSEPDNIDGKGVLTSNLSSSYSDLILSSQDEVMIYLNADGSDDFLLPPSTFTVYNGDGVIVFQVRENGDYYFLRNKVTTTLNPVGIEQPVEKSADEAFTSDQALSPSFSSTASTLLEDFGSAALVNGVAEVSLSPAFADSLGGNSYLVLITPLGDCNGLFVAEKLGNSFIVKELGGGTSNVSFDFHLVAQFADKE